MAVKFSVERTTSSKLEATDFSNLRFGDTFADHMFESRYRDGEWDAGRILPYGAISLDPSFSVLHYGQAVFEGMKAFRYAGGKINIFRLDAHYQRFYPVV